MLVPAATTLGGLHRVIQILYGWDGDHLHDFAIGDRRYSDPFFDLEEVTDEEELRVPEAFRQLPEHDHALRPMRVARVS